MIHIATVHHQSSRWIEPQGVYLQRTMREPYKLYGSLEGMGAAWDRHFDVVVPSAGSHAGKLNLLARIMTAGAQPDDIIVFLDGDAFPIVDPMRVVRDALASTALVAVRRGENLGDRQPHPSFCATTAGFWQSLGGDWSDGFVWENAAGQRVTDVGGNLLHLLESADASWTPLTRSNRNDLHPVFFGIYGGIIYHHGAGFRPGMPRRDHVEIRHASASSRSLPALATRKVFPGLAERLRRARLRQRQRESRRLGEEIYRQLTQDPEFYRQFL